MTLVTEPVFQQTPQDDSTRTAKDYLDALAGGECDQAAFLVDAGELLRDAPDTGWELLALVDQYYRRGKISAETFGTLKTYLQGLMVGKGNSGSGAPFSARAAGAPAPLPVIQESVPTADPPVSEPSDSRFAEPGEDPDDAPAGAPEALADPPEAAPSAPRPPDVIATAEATAPSTAPRALVAGDLLRGRYRIQGMLGRGGMGTVFAATDQERLDPSSGDQRVALKVLHTEVIQRPRLFAELRREFQHLQSLSHPNIVRVHEFDRDGDLAFFTMEYLSGALLSRVLSAGDSRPLYRPYALAIVRDVGAALAHAHARGVVHGDLNPANVYITDSGEVRVLDFGASHQVPSGPWISEFGGQPQVAVATPSYASCQVLEGEIADTRDDVYALACITYVLLTGKHPFGDQNALKARTARMRPDRPQGLSRQQWNALRDGLQFSRERRPGDLRSWLGQLDLSAAAVQLPELLSLWVKRGGTGSTNRWLLAAAAAAVAVACGWWAATHPQAIDPSPAGVAARLKSMIPQAAGPSAAERAKTGAAEVPVEPPHRAGASAKADGAARADGVAKADNAAKVDDAAKPVASAPAPEAPVVRTSAPPTRDNPLTWSNPPPARAASSGGRAAAAAPVQTFPGARTRIELSADNVDLAPTDSMARLVVHRNRAYRDEVSFKWWTESGTAKPGQDFVPVAPRVEHIEPGSMAVGLIVPIVMDPVRRESKSFYVVIDEASENALIGPRTLTMVTIPGSD